MWQTIRSSLSAARRGDAPRGAKHGPASKGFEHDAICETEEIEAAGADSTKGAEEAQRGMR
eukprot:5751891-Prymnesium_polylepis.1